MLGGQAPVLVEALGGGEVGGRSLIEQHRQQVTHAKRAQQVVEALELGDAKHGRVGNASGEGGARRGRIAHVEDARRRRRLLAAADRRGHAVGRHEGCAQRRRHLAIELDDHATIQRRAAADGAVYAPPEEDLVVGDVDLQLERPLVLVSFQRDSVRVAALERGKERAQRLAAVASAARVPARSTRHPVDAARLGCAGAGVELAGQPPLARMARGA